MAQAQRGHLSSTRYAERLRLSSWNWCTNIRDGICNDSDDTGFLLQSSNPSLHLCPNWSCTCTHGMGQWIHHSKAAQDVWCSGLASLRVSLFVYLPCLDDLLTISRRRHRVGHRELRCHTLLVCSRNDLWMAALDRSHLYAWCVYRVHKQRLVASG